MIGYGLDRGGPKDSENAPNSFLTKINEKGFWLFVPDLSCNSKKLIHKLGRSLFWVEFKLTSKIQVNNWN